MEIADIINEDISDSDVRSFADQLKTKYNLKDLWLSNMESRNAIELSSIIVGKENQKSGTGTAAMNDIINFADKHGKIVVLDPGLKDSNHGTTSKSRLIKFYKRFGFIQNKGRNKDYLFRSAMIRYPQTNENVNEADETYTPPKLKVGDEVKVGKFKNRKAEIKGFDTDDHGQPVLKTTKGEHKLFKPRISKLDKIDEVLKHAKRKWML